MNNYSIIRTAGITAVLVCVAAASLAQTRKGGTTARPQTPAATVPAAKATVAPTPTPQAPKRNARPDERPAVGGRDVVTATPHRVVPAFRYEFTQPEFTVSRIIIEHDEIGKGTISFTKKGDDEMISDPVEVSPRSLSRINDAFTALDFLNSTESYQYEKDFSHLGNIKFARTSGGKTREVTFNWTVNKDAKALMDEYRKIANQYVWVFDVSLARDNQPLESPRLFDALDSMIKRNEISDVMQLEPFLRSLTNDERLPLIARNHAARLVKQFEKEKGRDEKK